MSKKVTSVGEVFYSQFLLVVIGRFLTLGEKVVLSTVTKTHHQYVNRHGLNYVVCDIRFRGMNFYRNPQYCRDIDGLMVRDSKTPIHESMKPLGLEMAGLKITNVVVCRDAKRWRYDPVNMGLVKKELLKHGLTLSENLRVSHVTDNAC